MVENIILSISFVIFLLILSGLLSGSETSITSVSKSKIHKLAIRGDKRAKALMKIINKKNDLISSLLIGNNFVNILASALATAILIKFYGDRGILYSTILMSLLIVIFSEVLPKNYALIKPDRFALGMTKYLSVFLKIIFPIMLFVKFINWFFFKIMKIDMDNKTTSKSAREDIRNIIDMNEGCLRMREIC